MHIFAMELAAISVHSLNSCMCTKMAAVGQLQCKLLLCCDIICKGSIVLTIITMSNVQQLALCCPTIKDPDSKSVD